MLSGRGARRQDWQNARCPERRTQRRFKSPIVGQYNVAPAGARLPGGFGEENNGSTPQARGEPRSESPPRPEFAVATLEHVFDILISGGCPLATVRPELEKTEVMN